MIWLEIRSRSIEHTKIFRSYSARYIDTKEPDIRCGTKRHAFEEKRRDEGIRAVKDLTATQKWVGSTSELLSLSHNTDVE
ncbi:hypothetical protein EVAR_99224_1 [Eumeta japonica]|uniref:Uncharacterized protein n=1 Tax=Eumeta variegata TaxID=151549 RepID=A0A4C1YKV6_EUMVA|nr:hypothetical protein EVAR_99224_1 [Eumeta japonica]